ncbi:hypothetical protein LINPERHAP1_LOCUS17557 [Linum perenne]
MSYKMTGRIERSMTTSSSKNQKGYVVHFSAQLPSLTQWRATCASHSTMQSQDSGISASSSCLRGSDPTLWSGWLIKHKTFAAMRDVICPTIMEQIEWTKIQARTCVTQPTLDDVLQCTDHGRGFVVDLRRSICTCDYWQLSGVPCLHGIAAMSYMRYDIKGYVDKWYSVELAKKAYAKGIPPLPGHEDWVEVEGLPVLPPPYKVMPGRPKKNRRKEPGEVSTRPSRTGVGRMMKKTGAVMHCSRCGQADHNVRGCKMTPKDAANLPKPPPPKLVGRPRRRPIQEPHPDEENDQVC